MQPLVAIIGSADPARAYDPPLRDHATAGDAARRLGHELATRSCPIVVYSSDPTFLEQEVVRGYLESPAAKPRSIRVVGRYGRNDIRFIGAENRPECFDVISEAAEDWEVAFYRSLLHVDAVLLVGGGQSTLVAGLIALSRGIAIAPVPAFGGSGEKLWRRLTADGTHVNAEDITELSRPWQSTSAPAVVASLVGQHQRRLAADTAKVRETRQARRRTTTSLAIAVLVLLAALAMIPLSYTIRTGTWTSIVVLIAGPVLASICGAIIRNAFDDGESWFRAAVLGTVAGTIAFILFVVGQLATSPDLLDGGAVRRLIVVVLMIGFAGGFTSEVVYRKLKNHDSTQTHGIR